MRGFAANIAMFAVLIVDTVESANFLQGRHRSVHGCHSYSLMLEKLDGFRDGISRPAVPEKSPNCPSLRRETHPQHF